MYLGLAWSSFAAAETFFYYAVSSVPGYGMCLLLCVDHMLLSH